MDIIKKLQELDRKLCCLIKNESGSFLLKVISIGDATIPDLTKLNTVQTNNSGETWIVDSYGNSQQIEFTPPSPSGSQDFQSVTDNGAETTQNFFLIDGDANALLEFLNNAGAGNININDWTSEAVLYLNPGEIILQNFDGFSASMRSDNVTADVVHQLPNADGTYGLKVNGRPFNAQGDVLVDGSAGQSIVSGGIVTWISGYTYNVSMCIYTIAGILYTSPSVDITLDPADGTYDRIDTFVVTTGGVADILTGTPAVNPSSPTPNPLTQLQIGVALVQTGTTSPVVVQDSIYLENAGSPTEWDSASSAPSRLDPNSISSPLIGSKSIEATATINNDILTLTRSVPDNAGQYTVIRFSIKSKATWSGSRKLDLSFWNGTTKIGSSVFLSHNTYGFDSSNTTSIQTISIPLSAFGVAVNVDIFKIKVVESSGAFGFWMDNISVQYSTIPITQAYWIPNGNDIYNANAGNVGIGNLPTVKFQVFGITYLGVFDPATYVRMGFLTVYTINSNEPTLGSQQRVTIWGQGANGSLKVYNGAGQDLTDDNGISEIDWGTMNGDTGSVYALKIDGTIIPPAGSPEHTMIMIKPVIDYSATSGSPILRGVWYNPDIALLNGNQNVAWRNDSGDVIMYPIAAVSGIYDLVIDVNGVVQSIQRRYKQINSNTSIALADSDNVGYVKLYGAGAISVTLPDANHCQDQEISVGRYDIGVYTIQVPGGNSIQDIDGSFGSSCILTALGTYGSYVRFKADGGTWTRIS